jgi:hypothetical protein
MFGISVFLFFSTFSRFHVFHNLHFLSVNFFQDVAGGAVLPGEQFCAIFAYFFLCHRFLNFVLIISWL